MEKRRQRILEQARSMLAEGGFDGLNLRDLAQASDVTVPTVYNLVGNKAAILRALVLDSFAEFESEIEGKSGRVEDVPELMMSTFADMIQRDEDYFRASALANERVELEEVHRDDYTYRRAPLRRYARHLCQRARDEGMLLGEIDSEQLIEMMIGPHQVAFRDWAHRMITLQELKRMSLTGFYIALAADASHDFRRQIIEKLGGLRSG